MATIQSLVGEKPVVIFSKLSCSMCHSVKSLIKNYGANVTVYEIDELSNGQQIERELLLQLGCQPSVPAVYIGQKFIGGADMIFTLQLKNELVPLLIQARAIWI
ncbi:monothiol glutaredoxin-S6 [Humulus lupulus]|uniref:monothiol glutaredoxin-S6 n=1 Tax=Humulus lupulus TaxID=3486 RepID=UPI002B41013D|nr:monothiol glutaredoxin-S6 [Humulus lupulus]